MGASPFDFTDPGECLLVCYHELKKTDPGASHRYISAILGLKSPAVFQQIIQGRINPSPSQLDGLARVFGFSEEQRNYLALLFAARHTKDQAVRTSILRNIRILANDTDAFAAKI